MKVTGFSFIKNAITYDYPIKESIASILPICDEFIIAVGESSDDTLNYIKSINSNKIKIIETIWNEELREGGQVLALETDKAFQAISQDTDWCFYIQGDEVVHEKYLSTIQQAMRTHLANSNIDGLLLNYMHFYGSYDYIGESYRWYRREIRIVRNNRNIYSYKDAQGFRKNQNQKLKVKLINAYMYHYGWVKSPQSMQKKQLHFHKYWHDDDWIKKEILPGNEFDYSNIDALSKFEGTQPQVMHHRIQNKNWKFNYDISKNKFSLKDKFRRLIEKITGYRLGEYKNYIVEK